MKVDLKEENVMPAAPRTALVTGCAGFLGSHLSERLLSTGWVVVGLDGFTDYYARGLKEANVAGLRRAPNFTLVESDLVSAPLDAVLDGVDAIFHLAAQPGVQPSFGSGLDSYLHSNVKGTLRLLEAAARRPPCAFVYASSSSVYGDQDRYPVREDAPLRPISPYGSTKVITEQLAAAFWRGHGVPAVGLRYFTVYGPRQRPDMAFSRFVARAVADEPLLIYGDGRQVREFTYVGDVVEATIAAAERGRPGSAYNIGGGEPVALLDAISELANLLGRRVRLEHRPDRRGDPRRTDGDTARAHDELGFQAGTPLSQGLANQLEATLLTALIAGGTAG